jgi:hypothetical protein
MRSMYEVEFYDGAKEAFAANIIAENMIAQVDEEGNHFVFMKEITGHQKGDNAMSEEDSWIVMKSGTHCRKPTTHGWLIQVDWKDGSSSLLPLKDIKNSHPVLVKNVWRALRRQLSTMK